MGEYLWRSGKRRSLTENFIESMGYSLKSVPEPRLPQAGYIYFLKASNGSCKIGCTKNPEKRLRAFRNLPFSVEYAYVFKTDDMYHLEAILHHAFRDVLINGEWFNLTDLDIKIMKGIYPND